MMVTGAQLEPGEVRQVTSSPHNHMLDNNDNFSPDDRYIVYDTRETVGPGIENSQSIEIVDLITGEEHVVYAADESVRGKQAAPGIGAASFSHVEPAVAFIHGPPLDTVDERGYYGKPNRQGGEVNVETDAFAWLDHRDIATDRDTLPGAHRGGTHRHEYSMDGQRIGFTYDDYLMPEYDRTIGFMVPQDDAPGDASYYFALLVRPVPKGTTEPGEIEKAYGDSWVGREGLMRAFIGKIKEDDGRYTESLFVVDVPKDIDITTADAGSADRFPTPPKGLTIRRITHGHAEGIARGTEDGSRVCYTGLTDDGDREVFIVNSDGDSEPVQATTAGVDEGPGARWHPSGHFIAHVSGGDIAVTDVREGDTFGKTIRLTDTGDADQICWSHDGRMLAFNRRIPTTNKAGIIVKAYDGLDFSQVFVAGFTAAMLDT